MPGDDRKDRSMRPGELGIREMSRTAVTEQPEEKVRIVQPGKETEDRR
jgi:hypothetical protein